MIYNQGLPWSYEIYVMDQTITKISSLVSWTSISVCDMHEQYCLHLEKLMQL